MAKRVQAMKKNTKLNCISEAIISCNPSDTKILLHGPASKKFISSYQEFYKISKSDIAIEIFTKRGVFSFIY